MSLPHSTAQDETTPSASDQPGAGIPVPARPWVGMARARSVGREVLWPLAAIVVSLLLLAPLLVLGGAGVIEGYSEIVNASFGSTLGFGSMLTSAVPLTLVGLGVALPYRAGLFNIGGEGQLLVGALAAVLIGTSFDGGPLSVILPIAGGFVMGFLLGAIPGILKARGMHEIVTTITLSFLVLILLRYLLRGPLKDPTLPFAASRPVGDAFRLGRIGGELPSSFIIALAFAIVVACYLSYTRAGFRQRLVGLSPALAHRQGVSVSKERILALAIGGGLAGVGGALELLGNQFRLGQNFSGGWGFLAVAIALLARGNALAVVPFALFFGALQNASVPLQANLGIPGNLVLILAAIPVLIVAAVYGFKEYREAVADPPDD